MTNDVVFRPLDSLQTMAYIIKKCRELRTPYNITKLQKLMYCCYGVTLATTGTPLCNEQPEAWQYGPVFPTVLKYMQANGIDKTGDKVIDVDIPDEIDKLIVGTITFFGEFTASQLSSWSHRCGSPWYQASAGGVNLKTKISDAAIKDYFAREVLA